MKPILSICIPTLNRPELLLQSLNSIFREPSLLGQLEICISNNGSEADYGAVDALLKAHSGACSIKYVRHSQRLPLDENHHCVKRLATTDYIYFLGDDDFFLRDELAKLLELIAHQKPDLAIFNGYLVDGANAYLGNHFTLGSREYESLEAAFRDLRDKGSFGAVLVRRDMLRDEDFEHLYRTDHAYGCYWLSLFRKHERGEKLAIMIPDFPCVALRCAQKTYNHIDVYFKKIPHEMTLRQQLVPLGPLRHLFDEQAAAFEKFSASLRFLSHLSDTGHDLRAIRTTNPSFYSRYKHRIWLAGLFGSSVIYVGLRRLYRKSIKWSTQARDMAVQAQIDYKLSSARE
jgi:abequosyltransferase